MSLALEREGTNPKGVLVKTHGKLFGMADVVFLGEYEVCIEDFLIAAHYVLTNTDLYEGDPRMQFIKSVQSMETIEGYNKGHKRLRTPIPPVEDFIPPFGG